MGLNICGIIINSLPKFTGTEQFDIKNLKTKFSRTKLQQLNPKGLSISFKNDCTLIFLDMIFYKNISEEPALTELEKDLVNLFPNSRVLIFVVNETVDFTGYSLIENGAKIRTKAVTKGEIFLDFGDIHSKELEVFNEFYNAVKSNPKSHKILEETFSSISDSEKKKLYIKTRDNLLVKKNITSDLNYTNGPLDSFIIETQFNEILGFDYLTVEELDFLVFEKRKLNFKKDSLMEYLFVTKRELQ